MRWNEWRRYFEQNARWPVPELGVLPSLPIARRAHLTRSLQKFQLGETSEGRLAHQVDGFEDPAVDDDFRACIKLFVREEGRHARVLGLCVRTLGAGLLERHWTATAFTFIRRGLGVRTKLLVALAAEVVGGTFYGQLASALDESGLSSALRQISADEDAHLAFQTDFFASQLRGHGQRAAWCWIWRACGAAASLIFLWDHRRTHSAFGLGRWKTWRLLWARVEQVVTGVRSAARPLAPVATRAVS